MKPEIDQQLLREKMIKSKFTIQQVAEGTRTSFSTIGNFRRGIKINQTTAEKIEAYLTKEGK